MKKYALVCPDGHIVAKLTVPPEEEEHFKLFLPVMVRRWNANSYDVRLVELKETI